ncbi:branched-chain amino acid ABC transporter substrate-binding protein, partial [Burkholderia pseudomallei]
MRIGSSRPSLAVAAAFAGGATGAARDADETPVRIGFAAPLTGVIAGYGTDLQYGVQLALDAARAPMFTIGGKTARVPLWV